MRKAPSSICNVANSQSIHHSIPVHPSFSIKLELCVLRAMQRDEEGGGQGSSRRQQRPRNARRRETLAKYRDYSVERI